MNQENMQLHSKQQRFKTTRSLRRKGRKFTDPIFAGNELSTSACLELKKSSLRLISHVLRSSPINRVRLLGTPFPKHLRNLADSIPTPSTDVLEAEIAWSAAAFVRHAGELTHAIALARHATRAILTANYDEARSGLTKLRNEHGHSLFLIKLTLLLEELDSGLEANRRTKKDLAEDSPPLVLLFLHFFSQQSEATVSAEDYYEMVNAFLSPDAVGEPYSSYFCFRLGGRIKPAPNSLTTILNFEESHSLLDRYLTWSKVVRLHFAKGIPAVQSSLAQSVLAVAETIQDLDAAFPAALIDPSFAKSNELFDEVYRLVDLYTRGNYASVVKRGNVLLNMYPDCFELYELTVKSSLHLGAYDADHLPSNSIASEVAKSVSHVLTRSDSTQEHLRSLNRLACRLFSTPSSQAIEAFVRQHSTDELPLRLDPQTSLSGVVPTPRVLATLRSGDSVLESLLTITTSNAAVQLFLADHHAIANRPVKVEYPTIPEARRIRHRAYVQERLGDYEAALSYYQTLSSQTSSDSLHHADVRAG